jgi:hypothetical protein
MNSQALRALPTDSFGSNVAALEEDLTSHVAEEGELFPRVDELLEAD